MQSRSLDRLAALATVLVLVLTGCAQAESVDKAGGETVVLRLATIDQVNPNGQYFGSEAFVEALESVSNGRLKVEMVNDFGEGAPDAESKLVEAIASGEVDGGAPSTRAFAGAGIDGLQVIEAPMTITSYDAQKALVSGPIAAEVLGRLEGTGVVGLGLAVGPLRRPFAGEAPLLGPEDWDGIRFRVYNSEIQGDAISALGGEPVNLGFAWIEEVRKGNLRGAEFDIPQYWTNGLTTEAGNVTANVVLWPKVIVLALSQQRWDTLSDEQQGWVRAAADQAVQTSVESTYDETSPAQKLCAEGVRFIEASAEQIVALRERLAPVLTQLAGDPLMADIQALAAQHPDADVPDVPVDCRQAAASADPNAISSIPETISSLPAGIYRADINPEDLEAAGLSNGSGWTGTWTMTIEDGTYATTCRPIADPEVDCGGAFATEQLPYDAVLEAGLVRGSGDRIFFVYDAEIHSRLSGCELPCFPLPTFEMSWAMDGDTLTFDDPEGAFEPYYQMTIKDWTKIG